MNTNHDQAQRQFPLELLSASKDDRLKYFRELTIAHPLLKDAFETLWRAVKTYNEGSMILVYGPTGVGKTTLMKHLERCLKEELFKELEQDLEMVPLIKIEAPSPPNGNFDWKDCFGEMLAALGEPAIPHKIDIDIWHQQPNHKIPKNARGTLSAVRQSLEQALRHRRPKVVLIDEAQHLTALSSGRKLLDQQNTIKSLANRTRTTYALFGSYELMPLRHLNGQLSRRSVDIHFRRYRHDEASDWRTFRKILRSFQQQLPLREETNLVGLDTFIYEGCLGCIGILKDWLYRALSSALDGDSPILSEKHLAETALPPVKRLKILNEALNGEKTLEDEQSLAVSELNGLIQFKLLNGIKVFKGRSLTKEGTESKTPKKNHQVGVRKPMRDAIGNGAGGGIEL